LPYFNINVENLEQTIDLKLTESGATLRSESCGIFSSGSGRKFKFSQPFFMFIKEEISDSPYFGAYIQNPASLQ